MFAPDSAIGVLLEQLASDEPERAWNEFLACYSAVVYQVVQSFVSDVDECSDCFLYACEQLATNRFKRLRRFAPDGRARFSTWLRAVVRNLCLDWHRHRFGRRRVFQSVAARPVIDQRIFGCVFQRGMSTEDICRQLRAEGHPLSFVEVEERVEALRQCLTARQLWLLTSAQPVLESLDNASAEATSAQELVDPSPDPETLASLHEIQDAVSRVLGQLNDGERLLIRLRFQEGLSLEKVACLVGLKDAQTTDRRIREIIEKLRVRLSITLPLRGKTKAASV